MTMRWSSPPEHCRGRRPTKESSSPTSFSMSDARRRRSPCDPMPCCASGAVRLVPIRMRGSSAAYGFWKMSCIEVRKRRSSSPCSAARPRPATVTEPLSGGISRSRTLARVLLPQPDSPTRPMTSPRRIPKLTPSSERTLPFRHAPTRTGKCFTTPSTTTKSGGDPATSSGNPVLCAGHGSGPSIAATAQHRTAPPSGCASSAGSRLRHRSRTGPRVVAGQRA